MIDISVVKGLAAASSVAGSILLAIRVKGLLEALAFVADMHEHNIKELASPNHSIVLATNAPKHIENAKRTSLLMAGFGLLILSGALNLWAAFL